MLRDMDLLYDFADALPPDYAWECGPEHGLRVYHQPVAETTVRRSRARDLADQVRELELCVDELVAELVREKGRASKV